MENILRAASDIGGYAPETNPRYEPYGQKEGAHDITREHLLAVLEAICEGEPVNLSDRLDAVQQQCSGRSCF